MDIPDKIRIGAVDYTVTYVDKPILVHNRGCKGAINYDQNTIELLQDGDMSEQSLCITLLHEVIHGILRDRMIDVEDVSEEDLCDHFAVSLYQIIRDNPDIFGEGVY